MMPRLNIAAVTPAPAQGTAFAMKPPGMLDFGASLAAALMTTTGEEEAPGPNTATPECLEDSAPTPGRPETGAGPASAALTVEGQGVLRIAQHPVVRLAELTEPTPRVIAVPEVVDPARSTPGGPADIDKASALTIAASAATFAAPELAPEPGIAPVVDLAPSVQAFAEAPMAIPAAAAVAPREGHAALKPHVTVERPAPAQLPVGAPPVYGAAIPEAPAAATGMPTIPEVSGTVVPGIPAATTHGTPSAPAPQISPQHPNTPQNVSSTPLPQSPAAPTIEAPAQPVSGTPSPAVAAPSEAPVRLEAAPAPARMDAPRVEQPRLDPPPTPEQVRQVHRQLAAPAIHLATSAEGVKTMTIRLHPEELGQITVVARLQGTSTHLELIPGADTSRELVRSILPDLRRDLANHHADATLDLDDEAGQPRQGQPGTRDQSPTTSSSQATPDTAATPQTRGTGRLDISA